MASNFRAKYEIVLVNIEFDGLKGAAGAGAGPHLGGREAACASKLRPCPAGTRVGRLAGTRAGRLPGSARESWQGAGVRVAGWGVRGTPWLW